MSFPKGQSGNPKGGKIGHKGGGGRPPDALKEACKGIIDKYKLVHRLGMIASGQPIVWAVGPFGPIIDKDTKKQILIPAPIKVQEDAISELLDRGHGKATQNVESSQLDEVIEQMRKRYTI